MKIKEAFNFISNKIHTIDIELLLCHVLGVEKTFLYKESDYKLNKTESDYFIRLLKEIQRGTPLAYITNHKEFYGLDFFVDERVLIPRPETEILVQEVISYIKKLNQVSMRSHLNKKNEIILAEIGTGSGCISISIAKELQVSNYNLKIYATDISNDSLNVARLNAKKHQTLSSITFLKGDLLNPLPEKVDIITANLPYVKLTFLKRSSSKSYTKEPKTALDGGIDGLKLIKKLLKQARYFLKPKGAILLEIDPHQRIALEKFCRGLYPNSQVMFIKDLARLDRVILVRPRSISA